MSNSPKTIKPKELEELPQGDLQKQARDALKGRAKKIQELSVKDVDTTDDIIDEIGHAILDFIYDEKVEKYIKQALDNAFELLPFPTPEFLENFVIKHLTHYAQLGITYAVQELLGVQRSNS